MRKIFEGNYRWFIVGLLLVATTINYVDRQIIGLLKPMLEKEFSWTETDFAHIVMAFTAAYAIGYLLSGKIIDQIGTKLGFALAVTVWSVAGMAHAIVNSVLGFSVARVVLGFGEGGNFPGASKAVAEWFPKKERAIATGIFNSGPSVGVIVSLITVPILFTWFGWRNVFWITGSLGFVWLIAWWIFYDLPSRQKRITESERSHIHQDAETISSTSQPIKWFRLFVYRQTWAVVIGKLFIDPIWFFFLFWLPSYFSSTFSLDLSKPSVELLIIYSSATIGSVGGGFISSTLIGKGWSVLRARKVSLLVFALLEFSVMLIQYAPNVWVAVFLISLAVAVHQAWSTNVFTLASDMFPNQAVSSVVGIAGMAGSVGGILFPILIGYLLDTYKAQGNITVGYNILFICCSMAYIISLSVIHLLTRNHEKISLEQIKK